MKKICTYLVILCVVAIFFGTFFFLYKQSQPAASVIRTETPWLSDIVTKTIATGSIQPRKEIEIKPQVPGIISDISVREGDMVESGQVIATIRLTPNLVRVNEAEARVSRAKISLEDTKKTWLREKLDYDRVLEGGTLLPDRESPYLIKLRQATADFSTTKLNLADAHKTHTREEQLFNKQVTSASAFQEAKHALNRAIETHKKAKDLYSLIREETIEDIEKTYQKAEVSHKQAQEELESALRNLQLIREGAVSEKSEESNTLIRSTIGGMILEIPVKVGTQVTESNPQNSGTTIATVADMNDMIFKGQIDETEIGKIKTGMELKLTIGAIEGESFLASIEQIAPKGKIVEGTTQFGIEAKVNVSGDQFIRAGYSASADIILDKRVQVLSVNEGNLLFEGGKVYAFVADGVGGFDKRELQSGLSDGIVIEIVSGLSEGEKIKVLK